jgi:hypothetical protein
MTGQYAESELPALLAKVRPHVVWFPAQWPETYSYTLTAATAVLNATDSHPVAASPPARRLSESDLQQVADLVIS